VQLVLGSGFLFGQGMNALCEATQGNLLVAGQGNRA
jgi:hypothetical protein